MSDLEKLSKKYGNFIELPGQEKAHNLEFISTGSLAVDMAIGPRDKACGIPRGLVTTIWGKEGSGKTTFAANCMAEAQAFGKVAFINTELKFDPEYFQRIGIDMNKLTLVNLNYYDGVFGEQIGQAIIEIARTGEYSMICCDSVAALVPKRIAVGEMGEESPGLHARLVAQILYRLISPIKQHRVAMLFTTQRTAKFGAQSFAGPAYEIVGGNKLKFFSAVLGRIDYKAQKKDSGGDVIGIQSRITFQKNVGDPFTWADFSITDGYGVDKARELFAIGGEIAYNKGSWYYYVDPDTGEEIKLGQGEANAVQFMRENPAIMNRLRDIVKDRLAPVKSLDDEDEGEDSDS
jgi:recombination protein RecA